MNRVWKTVFIILILMIVPGMISMADETRPAYMDEQPDEENGFYPAGLMTEAGETDLDEQPDGANHIFLDPSWQFAENSEIHSGYAVLYKAEGNNRKDFIIGLNAGHGTRGGTSVRTLCHPDGTPKVTGGSTAKGAVTATAVSDGMVFPDGTTEAEATFMVADMLREKLLDDGFDVLMIRDGVDVQLDNVARTVICNNNADCHIAIHFDSDYLDYDKGCFYTSVPDELKYMEHVADVWELSESLGKCLVRELAAGGVPVYGSGNMDLDLTQTAYSTIPSVDIELGNEWSDLSDEQIEIYADALLRGIRRYIKD